jgi:hypothetical protein
MPMNSAAVPARLNRRRLPAGVVTLLLIVASIIFLRFFDSGDYRFTDLELHYAGKVEPISTHDWRRELPARAKFVLHGKIVVPERSRRELIIIPDDCIERMSINGLDLGARSPSQAAGRCDYDKGVRLNARPWLHSGVNDFEIEVSNAGGLSGVTLSSPFPRHELSFLVALILIVACLELRAVLGLSSTAFALVIFGVIVRVVYLSHTTPEVRSYDVFAGGGHVDFIKYIVSKLTLPPANEGWEYHQPPLYYLLAAPVYAAAKKISPGNEFFALQSLSVALSTLFLLFGAKLFEAALPKQRVALLLLLLFAVWPAAVMHSTRIGNDILVAPLIVASLVGLQSWLTTSSRRALTFALFCAAGAVFTKANALVLLPIFFGTFWLWTRIRPGPAVSARTAVFVCSFLGGAALLSFTPKIYHTFADGSDWLLGGVPGSVSSGLAVENKLKNFACFDIRTYLRAPFTSTWSDDLGRQCFANFFLKTALFGEFNVQQVWARHAASGLGVLLLLLVAISLWGCAKALLHKNEVLLLHMAVCALALTSLLFFRIREPLSCNADFRYIIYCLPSFYCCLGAGFSSKKAVYLLQAAVVVACALLSLIFLLTLFVSEKGW